MASNTDKSNKIDEGLYSRQLYTIGFEAMEKISKSSVLIYGVNGLGVEIAKNIILPGFKSVTLCDIKPITLDDVGTNYYATEADIGKNRAEHSCQKLRELNPYVEVKCIDNMDYNSLIDYSVVIFVDCSVELNIMAGNICHNKTKFIATNLYGLIGSIFCDNGDNFKVIDPTGEEPQTRFIDHIENKADPIVTCIETKGHFLTNGDFVTFKNIKGLDELNDIDPIEIQYVGEFQFRLKGFTTENFGKYISGGEFIQIKPPVFINNKSYEDSLKAPEIILNDYCDMEMPTKAHSMCLAHDFLKKLTPNYSFDQFKAKANELFSNEIDSSILLKFFNSCNGTIQPMISIIGGIVAQEALKSSSGKYMPINQWLYIQELGVLGDITDNKLDQLNSTRYDRQISIFGYDFQKKLSNEKLFMVGVGAIGSELLKNFAMMGVATGSKGSITITDMDTIEKSNLNRQFLFRPSDISKPKSECAAKAIQLMNPSINITRHLNKVCKETENIYNMDFFGDKLVVNALDNIQAREYVDGCCVRYKRPLLESGTLGTKGNTQVIIPHLTESYGSQSEDAGASIPVCTVKSFPNQIEHCIQWSREQFAEWFDQSIRQTIQYIDGIDHESFTASEVLSFVSNVKFVLDNRPTTFEDCIRFALKMFNEMYINQIKILLEKFPQDAKTSTGTPFWISTKKCPSLLSYDMNNEMQFGYVFNS